MNEAGNTVGARIALARGRYQLTQSELGANLGVTRAAISQYEQDKIRPRHRVIDKLAELFNSDPEWFERGRGKAPDALDAPVTVHEVNVEKLAPDGVDLKEARVGRRWQLPAGTLPGLDHMVAIVAPNDAKPIRAGDRVLIDTQACDGAGGMLLVVDAEGARLTPAGYRGKARIVGRVAAYLRVL